METNQPKQEMTRWEAGGFVWEVLLSVAVPTTLFALAGRWLDRRWNVSPWMTVAGLALALVVSALLVLRKARQYKERL